ncbi:hypothetical protein BFJ71_g16890 [Fusarium oxysporum]|nr:hypothetical protein BFJ71_g16890 [Fusarium oxysporum]
MPYSVSALADLALRAGLPAGVFNVITTCNTNTPVVSKRLCKHNLVRKVTFTGSTTVGSIVAKHCSKGPKKLTIELGGNCPFIVFNNGDLVQTISALMILKCSIHNAFVSKVVAATKDNIKVGHGVKKGTTIGPLTTQRGIDKLKKHIEDAVSKGRRIHCGG